MRTATARMLVVSMLAVAMGSLVALAPATAYAACPDPANVQSGTEEAIITSGYLVTPIMINGNKRYAAVGTIQLAAARDPMSGMTVVTSTLTMYPNCGKINLVSGGVYGAKATLLASIGGNSLINPAVNPWVGSVTVPAKNIINDFTRSPLVYFDNVETTTNVDAIGGREFGLPR